MVSIPPFDVGMQLGGPPGKMAAMAKKVFAQVHFVWKLHPFLDWEVLQMINLILVISKLDLCGVIEYEMGVKFHSK